MPGSSHISATSPQMPWKMHQHSSQRIGRFCFSSLVMSAMVIGLCWARNSTCPGSQLPACGRVGSAARSHSWLRTKPEPNALSLQIDQTKTLG